MRRAIAACCLFGSVLAGSVASTQYLAHTFGYAPQLGKPLASLAGVGVYSPLSWYTWQRQWRHHAPRTFLIAWASAFGCVASGVVAASALAGGGSRMPKPSGAYGTSRWATLDELKKARLLSDRGIVLGQISNAEFDQDSEGRWRMRTVSQLIRYDGDGHTAVFATTRAGKGITSVVPTLLSYTDGTVVVHDPKGENWRLTAAWRSKFSHCLKFEPTAPDSVRFNPLLEVRAAPYDVRDVQNIAEALVNQDQMTAEQRDHWKLTGHAFLVGVILHVLYAEPDKSIGGVLKVLTDPDRTIEELLDAMLITPHLPSGRPHPVVAGAARAMIDRAENERSGVQSTATSFLEIYRDPLLAANTAASDFTIADLMCAERPVSLYFVLPSSDQDRIRPVVRLMLNVIGRRLTEHLSHVDCGAAKRTPRRRAAKLPALGGPFARAWSWAVRQLFQTAPAELTARRLARAIRPHLQADRPIELMLNADGRLEIDHALEEFGRDLRPKRRELLWFIDEFTMLRRIPFFAEGISSMAGYRLKCVLILQSLKQLEDVYGRANSIIDNCTNRVTYGTMCDQTAERISRLLGTQTLVRTQLSVSKRPGLFGGNQVTESYQEYGRPLKTVDEVLAMPFPEAIILAGNCRPYLGRKILYYQDPRFASRAGKLNGDGPNRPPTSRRERQAELPPQRDRSHWLYAAEAPRAASLNSHVHRQAAPRCAEPVGSHSTAAGGREVEALGVDELDRELVADGSSDVVIPVAPSSAEADIHWAVGRDD